MKIGRYVAGVIFIILPSQRQLLFIGGIGGIVSWSFVGDGRPNRKEGGAGE